MALEIFDTFPPVIVIYYYSSSVSRMPSQSGCRRMHPHSGRGQICSRKFRAVQVCIRWLSRGGKFGKWTRRRLILRRDLMTFGTKIDRSSFFFFFIFVWYLRGVSEPSPTSRWPQWPRRRPSLSFSDASSINKKTYIYLYDEIRIKQKKKFFGFLWLFLIFLCSL